jgi:homocysteine S-methyltransferase
MILDGGFGTELQRRGCDVQSSLWSARALLQNPEIVERIHLDYLHAGSDCITTGSYQVSFEGFIQSGLTREDAIRALKSSVVIAKAAREQYLTELDVRLGTYGQPSVAASVGPYGASLADGSEYHGNYKRSFRELVAFHRERIEILVATGPDILACETIPSLMEAEAMLRAVQDFPGIQAWFTFVCLDRQHNAHGELLCECARLLRKEDRVVGVGVNCTAPHLLRDLIGTLASELGSDMPIVVYPNAGRTWNAQQRAWVGETSIHDLPTLAREWRKLGASWIGGCCGFAPKDISQIRAALSADSSPRSTQ